MCAPTTRRMPRRDFWNRVSHDLENRSLLRTSIGFLYAKNTGTELLDISKAKERFGKQRVSEHRYTTRKVFFLRQAGRQTSRRGNLDAIEHYVYRISESNGIRLSRLSYNACNVNATKTFALHLRCNGTTKVPEIPSTHEYDSIHSLQGMFHAMKCTCVQMAKRYLEHLDAYVRAYDPKNAWGG